MARSKNATALFEVIHTSKKPPKAGPTGGSIPAPKWWAKGGGASADRPAPPAAAERSPDEEPAARPAAEPARGGTRQSWLSAARRSVEKPIEKPTERPEAADEVEGEFDPEPSEVSAPAAESSKVFITRIYPPGHTGREEPADVEPEADADEGPMFSSPPEAESEPVPAPRPAAVPWAARRPQAAPPRAAERAPERTFERPADFDPTAGIGPSGRPSKWADDEPAAPRPPRVRRSAGPTPSAVKAALDPAVSLDRDSGEVRFRLSYGGAVAAAVILLVVILIAYLAGTRTGGGESIADGPVAGRQAAPSVAVGPARPTADLMAAATGPAGTAPAAPAAADAATVVADSPPTAPAEVPARQVGLMYAVVQSYPDRETADRAGEFLDRNGIPCTVVPGLAGFALHDWCSVVGARPFARGDHGPTEQAYLKQIVALGPKFSKKAYNQFEPQLYLWRADSDTPRP